MSYYVRRDKPGTPGGYAYVGPIRSARQAGREAEAWNDAGREAENPPYNAVVMLSTPEVRAAVRAWVKAVNARRARILA
jgi:hypothetical protein